jgi:signal transduction histidine kinase
MAYSLAVGVIAEGTRYLTESLATPYAASIHSIALVLGEISWMPSVFFYVFLIPLYFPTGKLLSPRWRALVIFVVGIQIWVAISVIFRRWPAMDGTRVINGIPGSERFFATVQNLLVIPSLFAVLFILISMFLRYRRSQGVERIQMKWPVAAIVIYVFLGILYNILPGLTTIDTSLGYPIVWSLVMLFPISIGIAILRHRLFDIDIVINRTLVYGALTASVVGLYVLIVGGLGTVLQTQNNLPVIVIAILSIAFCIQPLRRYLQNIANRFVPVLQATSPLEPYEDKIIFPESPANMTQSGHWFVLVHIVWFVTMMVAAIVLLGSLPSYYSHAPGMRPDPYGLGQFTPLFQVLVELSDLASSFISLALAVLLFWRKPNDRMALFASFFLLFTSVAWSSSLGYFLTAYFAAPATFRLWSTLSIPPALLLFCIFPDGHFVPRWTRWIFPVSIPATLATAFSILASNQLLAIFGVVNYPLFFLVMSAQVYRYRRVSSYAERQQTKWWVFGVVVSMVLALIASLIYKTFSPPLINIIPLAFAIAILRSRLWDIDIIINRTLVYSALTASVVGLYVLIVGGLGAFLQTQNTFPGIVIAILLIAFLFQPLRRRLQDIVNRFVPMAQSALPLDQHEHKIAVAEGAADTTMHGHWLFAAHDVPSPKQEIEDSLSESQIPLRRRWLGWLLFTVICILSALSFIFLALSWATRVPDTWGFRGEAVLVALSFSGIGLLLARRHPQNSIGWFLLIAGLVNAIVGFCIEYATYALLTKPGALPYGVHAAWTASWLWSVGIFMLIYTFLLFPTGHLPSARWRPVAGFVVAAFALVTLTFMIQPGPLYFAPYLDNPFAVQLVYRVLNPLQVVSAYAILLIGISIVLRLRSAQGIERQQLKWFAYVATLITIIGITDSLAGAAGLIGRDPKVYQYLTIALWIALPFAIVFAIQRYRLWDIDLIINRTLVYGALSVGIVLLYILVVGALSIVSQTIGNFLISLLATGLIAFLFQPLRERLQRAVNRFMYGERDEPYIVLSQLEQRLETILAPTAILSTTVETIGRALKLPFVEIRSSDDQAQSVSFGEPQPRTIAFPLAYQNEALGELRVAPRTGESLSSADQNLLRDLARQIGIAIHAARATADLQRSRERLVLAREEERRRLRRDLHDDLAPTLASLGLTASTVADLIPTNPTTATKLVKELQAEIRATVGNIRRLVYDLRPPTLDELGLLAAVHERAAQYSNAPNGFHVTVDAPAELPALPAAVEVAAYRIVQEALENVSKHSQARTCSIRFANHNGLEIEIVDDGIGLPANIIPGVGLRSMRERAEELGGSCVIERGVNSGTCVLACLPIGEFNGTLARPDRG